MPLIMFFVFCYCGNIAQAIILYLMAIVALLPGADTVVTSTMTNVKEKAQSLLDKVQNDQKSVFGLEVLELIETKIDTLEAALTEVETSTDTRPMIRNHIPLLRDYVGVLREPSKRHSEFLDAMVKGFSLVIDICTKNIEEAGTGEENLQGRELSLFESLIDTFNGYLDAFVSVTPSLPQVTYHLYQGIDASIQYYTYPAGNDFQLIKQFQSSFAFLNEHRTAVIVNRVADTLLPVHEQH